MSEERPGVIQHLIDEFAKLPGIGPKSAERMTHFLLNRDRSEALKLAEALKDLAEKTRPCKECFNLTEGETCSICRDSRRDRSIICVVEYPRDLSIFERLGTYRGVYHVLNGRLAPLDNIGPDKLTFDDLARRVRSGGVQEVILATSPNLEGDGTALFASNLLAGMGVKITRLARGLPSGSSLELASTQMLADALEGRRSF
jgi:recombination protein RecR